jgi:hypothetical protein
VDYASAFSDEDALKQIKCRNAFIDYLGAKAPRGTDAHLTRAMQTGFNLFVAYTQLRRIESISGRRYKYVTFVRPDILFSVKSTYVHWTKQPHHPMPIGVTSAKNCLSSGAVPNHLIAAVIVGLVRTG